MKTIRAVLLDALSVVPGLFVAEAAEWISVAAPREGIRSAGTVARAFVNRAGVRSATWTVSGLGVFTAAVNGQEVGAEDWLKPGFTDPRKRKCSFSYDATDALAREPGATNILTAVLTSGWWSDGIMGKNGGKENAFWGELKVTYADGSSETIGTDASWVGARKGAVQWAGIWEGESYDAREALDLSDAATFSGWPHVRVNDAFKGRLVPNPGAEVRADGVIKPVRRWKAAGKVIYDFGQNHAGVPRFTFKAKRSGFVFNYHLGEMLNDGITNHHGDGPKDTVYLANLRGAAKDMAYVTVKGEQTYVPKYTFYGYRYLQFDETEELQDFEVESVVLTSLHERVRRGTLKAGDKVLDRLIQNAYWGMLSNYLSVPTDCPQRSERLGWTADTQVFAKTSSYFADTRGFFHKWMADLTDAQLDNGYFTDVAPFAAFGDGYGQAAWSDAGIVVPYRVWKQTGDTTIIRENWEAMMRYMRALAQTDYEMRKGRWVLADWLSYEKLSVDQRCRWSDGSVTLDHLSYQNYLNACYMLWDCELMAEMAGVIGRVEDAASYPGLANRTRARILKTWFRPDGSLIDLFDGMQTPRLMALKLGLGDAAKLKAGLVEAIHRNGDRLATGFVGTSELPEVLTAIGESELAWTLVMQHEFPGWLYSVDQGATTIWERWNGYTRDKGFGDVGMNSFNHYAYGSVVGWLWETGAGIRPGKNGGYKTFVLSPHPDPRAKSLAAEYKADEGVIRSAWAYDDTGACTWTYEIPEGTTAEVHGLDGRVSVRDAGTYTEIR